MLNAGIEWSFETFAEYLSAVERRGTILNFGCYVGHSPVRLFVMGDEGYEREATPAEISEDARGRGRGHAVGRHRLRVELLGQPPRRRRPSRALPQRHQGRVRAAGIGARRARARRGHLRPRPTGDVAGQLRDPAGDRSPAHVDADADHLPGGRPRRRHEGACRGPGCGSGRAPPGDVPAPEDPAADGQPLLLPHRPDLLGAARPGPLGVPGLLRGPGVAGRGDAAGARGQAAGRLAQVLRGGDGDPPRAPGARRRLPRAPSGAAPRSTCCAISPSTTTSGPDSS
jgi:hypothetical protein